MDISKSLLDIAPDYQLGGHQQQFVGNNTRLLAKVFMDIIPDYQLGGHQLQLQHKHQHLCHLARVQACAKRDAYGALEVKEQVSEEKSFVWGYYPVLTDFSISWTSASASAFKHQHLCHLARIEACAERDAYGAVVLLQVKRAGLRGKILVQGYFPIFSDFLIIWTSASA